MLTFDDMRGVGVSKMIISAILENPPLLFLESLVFQNLGHKQNMTLFEATFYTEYLDKQTQRINGLGKKIGWYKLVIVRRKI